MQNTNQSQTKNKNVRQEILSQRNENEIEEVENRNNPLDKERDIEEDASINDKDEESDKNNKNQGSKIKTTKNNIINSRDLLFLRKDNIAYFVDRRKTNRFRLSETFRKKQDPLSER